MYCLISFCNLGGGLLPLALGVINIDSGSFSYLDLSNVQQHNLDFGCTGITVCRNGDIYIAMQSGHPRILHFDKFGKFINCIDCVRLNDLHDIKCIENKIYIASTGNNRLFSIDITAPLKPAIVEKVFNEECIDILHFNSFCHLGSDTINNFLFSFTRRENGEDVGSIRLADNTVLLDYLAVPHTIFSLKNRTFVLDSKNSMIIEFDATTGSINKQLKLSGFLRGMSYSNGKLIVGRSSFRLDSRKNPTGSILSFDLECFRSGIYILNFEDLAVERFIDLSIYAHEIYDILAVDSLDPCNFVSDSLLFSSVKKRERILVLERWLHEAMSNNADQNKN